MELNRHRRSVGSDAAIGSKLLPALRSNGCDSAQAPLAQSTSKLIANQPQFMQVGDMPLKVRDVVQLGNVDIPNNSIKTAKNFYLLSARVRAGEVKRRFNTGHRSFPCVEKDGVGAFDSTQRGKTRGGQGGGRNA